MKGRAMRPIKFRFWDDTTRQFMRPAIAEFNADGELYTIRVGTKQLKIGDRISVNQFTGLVDVNGKEIFEGDLVAYTLHSEYTRYEPRYIKTCEFRGGGFNIKNIRNKNNYEVVGNIYEGQWKVS
jgi:uncharacterized phage protein (TIGR01671 family)